MAEKFQRLWQSLGGFKASLVELGGLADSMGMLNAF